ncbi:MAG TPA: HAMP domain-containing histidine kinase [Candidatus Agathobaculum intestinigallinarum]|nr:HAMP domain-containing histidine kinase [Candidatus Agathobaculum intestinigallinarum]
MKTKRRNYWSFFWRVGAGFLAFWLVVMAGFTLLMSWQKMNDMAEEIELNADEYMEYASRALSHDRNMDAQGNPRTEAELKHDLLSGAYRAGQFTNPDPTVYLFENAIIMWDGELLQSNRYWLAGYNQDEDEDGVWYIDMNDQSREIYDLLLPDWENVDLPEGQAPDLQILEVWTDGQIAYPKTITLQPQVDTGFEWVAQGEPTQIIQCSYDESKMQGLPLKTVISLMGRIPGDGETTRSEVLDSLTHPRRAALREQVESVDSPSTRTLTCKPWLVQYFSRNVLYGSFGERHYVLASVAAEAYPIKACLPTLVPVYGFSFALAVLFSVILAFALLRVWRKQERVEQARRDTTAALAHELKTPLSVLSATAELLSNDMAQDKRAHYLDVIRQQAARMDGSVGRMLELSRLEAGAKALRRAKFTLSDLAQERLDAAVPPDADLHTEVTVSGAEEIDADRALLARALDAILENAVQHTAPGGSIAVRIEKGVCAVVNTGAPIPPDALPRLWEAYYQADASRAAKGDGLGLSIAKTVFDLHGYPCGAENTDEGPRFWFRFG